MCTLPVIPLLVLSMMSAQAEYRMLIDDFAGKDGLSRLGTPWRLVSDRVMGGVSAGRMSREEIAGRRAMCLRGDVSLENNGGFLQLALDLQPAGFLDASGYTGIRLLVRGNSESYNLHLKTADISFPWQSYRSLFQALPEWREIRLPFQGFEPHRVDVALDTRRLSRLGIVAIGRAFTADLCIAEVELYRGLP